jgi:hypothetical protein
MAEQAPMILKKGSLKTGSSRKLDSYGESEVGGGNSRPADQKPPKSVAFADDIKSPRKPQPQTPIPASHTKDFTQAKPGPDTRQDNHAYAEKQPISPTSDPQQAKIEDWSWKGEPRTDPRPPSTTTTTTTNGGLAKNDAMQPFAAPGDFQVLPGSDCFRLVGRIRDCCHQEKSRCTNTRHLYL